MTINILLVDDHEFVRKGLVALLRTTPDIEVVGEAAGGRDAVNLALQLRPDLVLMDLTMVGGDGIEATRKITGNRFATKVLGLSMHEDPRIAARMLTAGASGYVRKAAPVEEVITAIREIVQGRNFISPTLAEAVNRELIHLETAGDRPRLSAREREVLKLVAEGHSSHQIAQQLTVTEKTIGFHRQNIMAKLDIHSVAEMTKYALREGLTTLEV